MITIVDYGMGNLASIRNMLTKLGLRAEITHDPAAIAAAGKLILPGVGAFGAAMANIADRELKDVLDRKVLGEKVPILGICLGMQLMSRGSEEGGLPGFGWIAADFVRFRLDGLGRRYPIPHMGWNSARPARPHPLFDSAATHRFYFVHSYYARCDRPKDVLATTDYGGAFVSAYGRDNIVGVQFHPEKSHRYGMALLKAFGAWPC
jgi:glutamine amidotransferase